MAKTNIIGAIYRSTGGFKAEFCEASQETLEICNKRSCETGQKIVFVWKNLKNLITDAICKSIQITETYRFK